MRPLAYNTAGRTLVAAALAVAAAAVPAARAQSCDFDTSLPFPAGLPDDPDFARCEPKDGVPPPPDCLFFDEQWNLLGCRPFTAPAAFQLDGTSGISVREAWERHTGDPEVVIAILDSGIDWNRESLTSRFVLNLGEAAPPTMGGVTCPDDDCDGDGRVSVLDYVDLGEDLVNYDDNMNGLLDPHDLIVLYADGIDDDGNGYVDDVAGWDFYEGDNDPYDDTGFGHGTGGSLDAVELGNDGSGSIGVAPDAGLMAVRVGDSFVVDVDEFALGLLYATDNGARAIGDSLGSYNNTAFARAAVEYAHDRGVVILGSMADENSRHHNWPATYPFTINTKAVIPITEDVHGLGSDLVDALREAGEELLALLFEELLYDSIELNTHTFLQHSPCSNFGAHTHWVFPSRGCSSGATAHSAGLVGLLASYSKQRAADGALDFDLTANEVKQVVTSTADDVAETVRVGLYEQYPAQPGWDQYYGYGRPHAGRAFDAVERDEIPPEAWFTAPLWYETLDPNRIGSVAIAGRVAADRAASYTYRVEVAPGVEPAEDAFELVLESEPRSAAFVGLLALWDVTAFRDQVSDPPDHPNTYAHTLRLRVTDDRGLVGEDRRQIFLHHDPAMVEGFPLYLGTSGESSPAVVDVDGDGRDEIVLATSDGRVHLWRADLREPPGWPVAMDLRPDADPSHPDNHLEAPAFASGAMSADLRASAVASVAVGDLGGSRQPEIVAAGLDGCVYAWDLRARRLRNFPVCVGETIRPGDPVDPGFISSPVIADVDGDGRNDIVAASMNQNLYVIRGDGSFAPGWPVLVRDPATPGEWRRIVSSPAVGELDRTRPGLEIVLGTNEVIDNAGRVYAFAATGELLPGWPVALEGPLGDLYPPELLPLVGEGVPASPAMADFDFDGEVEVAINVITGPYTLLDKNGLVLALPSGGFEQTPERRGHAALSELGAPSFGDVDGDGVPELLGPGISPLGALSLLISFRPVRQEFYVGVWDPLTAEHEPGFPAVVDDWQFLSHPIVADVTGDGSAEIIAATSSYLVRAFQSDGTEAADFPKHTGGWALPVPAVGDLDGDGGLELVSVTRNGWMFAWHTDGAARGRPGANVQWAGFRHDSSNTGNWNAPVR